MTDEKGRHIVLPKQDFMVCRNCGREIWPSFSIYPVGGLVDDPGVSSISNPLRMKEEATERNPEVEAWFYCHFCKKVASRNINDIVKYYKTISRKEKKE